MREILKVIKQETGLRAITSAIIMVIIVVTTKIDMFGKLIKAQISC